MPSISVIIGLYNCAPTLPQALDSLLAQTFSDWEAILCDDGSVDNTKEIAQKYAAAYPGKFKVIANERNMGLNYTLNHCLEYATGEYIARMDGDDLSLPDRFAKEIMALESHPEMAFVSTAMEFFDDQGVYGRNHPTQYPQPKDFMQGTPFCHAPCLVRAQAYRKVGGYTVDERLLRVEDYHLWVKMYAAGYFGMNLLEPLYQMRDDRNAWKRKDFRTRRNQLHVLFLAVRMLPIPFSGYVQATKTIMRILGLMVMPDCIYQYFHKRQLALRAR